QRHHNKIQELQEMNKRIQAFSKQHEQISNADPKAIAAWENNWAKLNHQVNQVEKGKEYQTVLEERPLDKQMLNAINLVEAQKQLIKNEIIPTSILSNLEKTASFSEKITYLWKILSLKLGERHVNIIHNMSMNLDTNNPTKLIAAFNEGKQQEMLPANL